MKMIEPTLAHKGSVIFGTLSTCLFRPCKENQNIGWAYLEGATYVIREMGTNRSTPMALIKAKSPAQAYTLYKKSFLGEEPSAKVERITFLDRKNAAKKPLGTCFEKAKNESNYYCPNCGGGDEK